MWFFSRSVPGVSDDDSNEREFWDRRADAWERRTDALNSFSDTYGIPTMDALRLVPGERVLDIGCGGGTTAVPLAARVAPGGEVVGVDISPTSASSRSTRRPVTWARTSTPPIRDSV
jgi:ubiquinone/menaquinone biosynthesis C-methylase UbiE